MTIPRGVLFDFNGVLVDDEHLHQAGFNDVLAPLGITMTDEAYHARYLGFDDRGAFTAVLRDFDHPFDEALVRDLIERKAQVYKQRAVTELRIYPGAAETVKRFAGEFTVGIVSGALRDEIAIALEAMRAVDAIRFIVAAEDVAVCKPDPEGYLAGLRTLREADASIATRDVVAIEDSIAGIESARAAGLSIVAVAHTYGAEELMRAGADVVVPTIADVSFETLVAAMNTPRD